MGIRRHSKTPYQSICVVLCGARATLSPLHCDHRINLVDYQGAVDSVQSLVLLRLQDLTDHLRLPMSEHMLPVFASMLANLLLRGASLCSRSSPSTRTRCRVMASSSAMAKTSPSSRMLPRTCVHLHPLPTPRSHLIVPS